MCIPHELPGGVVGVLARVEAAIAELAAWDANHADAGRADAIPAGMGGEVVLRVLAAQRSLGAVAAGLAGSFADSGEWAADGAPSAKAWIAGRINDDPAQARSLIGHAQVLADFPTLAAAWRQGAVSGRHVGVLRGILTRYHALRTDLIAVDKQVTAIATRCDPRQFDTHLRALCHRADPDTAESIDQARRRLTRLHASATLDGYVRIDGLLDPALGQHLLDALESARRAITLPDSGTGEAGPRDTRPISERNLDALARILNAATAHTGEGDVAVTASTVVSLAAGACSARVRISHRHGAAASTGTTGATRARRRVRPATAASDGREAECRRVASIIGGGRVRCPGAAGADCHGQRIAGRDAGAAGSKASATSSSRTGASAPARDDEIVDGSVARRREGRVSDTGERVDDVPSSRTSDRSITEKSGDGSTRCHHGSDSGDGRGIG